MINQPDKAQRLLDAVQALWEGCGEVPPKGAELRQAANQLASVLTSAQKIPRTLDKTLSPLSELTRYIEHRLVTPVALTLPADCVEVTDPLPRQLPRIP